VSPLLDGATTTTAINALVWGQGDWGGGQWTNTASGFDKCGEALQNAPANHQKLVIMITDGTRNLPTEGEFSL